MAITIRRCELQTRLLRRVGVVTNPRSFRGSKSSRQSPSLGTKTIEKNKRKGNGKERSIDVGYKVWLGVSVVGENGLKGYSKFPEP